MSKTHKVLGNSFNEKMIEQLIKYVNTKSNKLKMKLLKY